jgi:hypothetical protein
MTVNGPTINLLITADYELYLGRSFLSDDEVLFRPTERMMEVCTRLKAPITFFADICSVWAHQNYGLDRYVQKFEKQLIGAVSSGHDVQLHLHPHWLNSTFENGLWRVNTDKMYLYEFGFGDGPDAAPAIVKRGIEYLQNLLKRANPDYRCHTFRAAGLALQPDERQLLKTLRQNDVLVDTSIAKGLRFNLDTIAIDYSHMPSAANWYMNETSGIETPADSGVFEIPIATFTSGLSQRIGFLVRRLKAIKMRRGAGLSRSAQQTRLATLKTMINYNLRYVLTNPHYSFSCDTKGLDLKMLLNGFSDFIRQHRHENEIFVAMINHPKLLFEPQMEMLGVLIETLRDTYGSNIRFITASEAVRHVSSMAR